VVQTSKKKAGGITKPDPDKKLKRNPKKGEYKIELSKERRTYRMYDSEGNDITPQGLTLSKKKPTELTQKVWTRIHEAGNRSSIVKDGKIDLLQDIGTMVREAAEQTPELAGLMRDLKKAEDSIKKLKKELVKQEKIHKKLVASSTPVEEQIPTMELISSLRKDIGWSRRSLGPLNQKYDKLVRDQVRERLSEIRDFGANTSWNNAKSQRAISKEFIEDLQTAERRLPADWVEQWADDPYINTRARGYYDASTSAKKGRTNSEISVGSETHFMNGSTDRINTAIHELVHRSEVHRTFEYVPPVTRDARMGKTSFRLNYGNKSDLGKIGDDYRAWRVKNSKDAQRRKLTDIYGPDEKGYEDEFFNHYVGKLYEGQDVHTEILSMGIENAVGLSERKDYYKSDTRTIDFAIGVLSAL
jgi:hypothetical protein